MIQQGQCISGWIRQRSDDPDREYIQREKGWSTKGEGRGNGLYRAKEMIEKQENLYHQCRIEDDRVIQTLEIEQQE